MYRQHYLPTTGRSAVAVTRRRWSRRMLVAVAASVLGLLPSTPSLAQTSPAVVQAAQPGQSQAAALGGGLAGAVPSADHGPTHDILDGAVVSSRAPDERLDVSAALDQGRRLFFLQARYQDPGNGQADYYLAGPQGVSHQPLAEVFAPLAAWLAAPGHEREMVTLGLQTDPRSANPRSFDATCQAFTTALVPYLLKASDLPAGKLLAELTPAEKAALQSRPRVVTDWSACTGEQLPTAAPKAPAAAAPAAPTINYDHWMADMSDTLGPRLLKQVIIPGSHDAGTYNFGGAPAPYAQAQDEDIGQQLTAGSRYLDVRAVWHDSDYWNVHGSYYSLNVRLSQMLDLVADWANQPGHEKEIILLQVSVDMSPNMKVAQDICKEFLARAGHRLLQPSMLPTPNVWDLSMDALWSSPNHPTIITDWSGCTGQAWPDSGTGLALFGGFYANQCYANNYRTQRYGILWPGIKTTLTTALPGRYSAKDDTPDCEANWNKLPGCPYPELPDKVVHGLYNLGLQSTPAQTCYAALTDFAADEMEVHTAVQNWYLNNQYNAQQNLNIISGDFVESRGIVDLAILLNRLGGLAPGTLVHQDVAVYLIDSDGTRRHVPDPTTFVNLFGPTPAILQHFVGDITQGTDLRSGAKLVADGGKIYLVEPPDPQTPGDQGRKRWITSPEVFNQFGFDPSRVTTETLATYADGPDLTGTWQVRPGLLLQAPGDPKVYLVDVDGSLRWIPDWSTFASLYGDNGAPIEPHDLSGLTIGPDLTSGAYLATDGVKTYLVEPTGNDQGRKRWITNEPVFEQFAFDASKVQKKDPLVLAAMPCGPDLTGSLGPPTTTCNAPVLSITMDDQPGKMVLYCARDPRLTSPATLSLAAQTPNAPQPLSVTGSYTPLSLTVPTDYFPNGSYLLSATCATSGTPPFAATPLTLSSSQIPRTLRATPSSGLQLAITCANPQANGIHAVAYPATAGPNSPDAQTFDAPAGQSALQATYSRQANYDVRVDCSLGGGPIHTVTVLASAFPPALKISTGRMAASLALNCGRDQQLTSPATLSLAAQTPNAPPPLNVTGTGKDSEGYISLTVPQDYFPNGDYLLNVTCASSDTPPFMAIPATLSSSQIPTLRGIPSSGLQLAITCGNPDASGIHAVAYPAAAGPNSPDAQTFDAPAGQPPLQATYSRRANYDVTVDCTLVGDGVLTLTVPASAFPLALTIRTSETHQSLYCDRDQQLTSPATLSLAAQTSNAPQPLSVTGSDKTLVLTVQPDYFPAGNYQLNATCASSDAPPFTATPLTLSSSQIPTQKVSAEITSCKAQGGDAYGCALQVTLGAPLAVNTVFSVDIEGPVFNLSGGDSPQVTASPSCQNPPNPSPYLVDGKGNYTRYDVNISTGGCTAGAVVTFSETVTGAGAAPMSQRVTVPGLGTSETPPVLLSSAATPRAEMAPVDPAVFSGR